MNKILFLTLIFLAGCDYFLQCTYTTYVEIVLINNISDSVNLNFQYEEETINIVLNPLEYKRETISQEDREVSFNTSLEDKCSEHGEDAYVLTDVVFSQDTKINYTICHLDLGYYSINPSSNECLVGVKEN